MILQQPDVLLLDEPTNHLDLPSIEWLEKYLLHYQGSVVIVSHDKYFLNRMVNKIVEIYQQELHIYTGDYDFYETEKAVRMDLAQKAYENQQDYIRQNERLVERFRAKASKAAMAQSLIKKLDKLDRIEEPELVRPNLKINFKIDTQPGKIICELKEVSKRFGDNIILDHSDAEINRGDKIALIGANGKGKSTVLRIVAGTEKYEGERNWGHNVDESFYAQHQLEALHLNNDILEEMKTARSGKTDLELRSLLGCFLFSGDEVDKKIKVLSGGEKARVALAKVIASKANFLLLDEPTNHLDMHSVELLAEALNNYEGSYLLVSHDRYFISKTANKIWEIVDHKIKEFKGTYPEYIEWKERMEKQAREALRKSDSGKKKDDTKVVDSEVMEQQNKEQGIKNDNVKAATNQQPSSNNNLDRDQKKELQKIQRQFQKAEEEVTKKNRKKAELELELGKPENYSDHQKFLALETEYKKVMQDLAVANADYEKLFEKIMEMEGS
jgi:ATP-binding cassette, subfamily F, member 3